MTRALNNKIIVLKNSIGDKILNTESRADGTMVVYDELTNQYIHVAPVLPGDITMEKLEENGDVGPGHNQLAYGDHDHDLGNLVVLFENRIV